MDPKFRYQRHEVAASYDSARFRSLSGKWGNYKEQRALIKALDQIPDAQTALDVPCGTGRITELLLQRSLQVTGVDISEEMMAQAQKKLSPFAGYFELVKDDLESLRFESDTFDLVTCVRLFGHYPAPERIKMLKEIARVTRKWIIVQYFYETPITRFKRFIKRALLHTYEGVEYPLSEGNLRDELQSAGVHEEGRFWGRKYYSEEVFLLVSKYGS